MDDSDFKNRRKFPRIKYPCMIILREGDGKSKASKMILTHTENVGMGGICITLKESLKIYSSINIELDLLDLEDHLYCQGKVVWCNQRQEDDHKRSKFYDVGIEFEEVTAQNKLRLGKIVDRSNKKKE